MKCTQREKAEYFKSLHYNNTPIILPNARDVMSAKILERAEAKVLATTSAGLAASLGYADGEFRPKDVFLSEVAL